MKKEYVIFAGVNGAGKSTLYNLLEVHTKRVNSDEILRENGWSWSDSAEQARAMKEAVRRIDTYLREGISFNQETTLTGKSIVNNIKKAKELDFSVKVYYIGLESADLAVQRVAQRVRQGGHGVAEKDIRRRYEQSLQNLQRIIPICDRIDIYDNTEKCVAVATYENGIKIFGKKCKWLDKYISDMSEDGI